MGCGPSSEPSTIEPLDMDYKVKKRLFFSNFGYRRKVDNFCSILLVVMGFVFNPKKKNVREKKYIYCPFHDINM